MSTPADASAREEIIVGFDGSANSEQAFRLALMIAAKRGWRLRLIGAYTLLAAMTSPYTVTKPETGEQYRQAVVARITEVGRALAARAESAGVEAVVTVEEGDAAGILREHSAFSRLAVVGKRGRNALANRFMGSVSNSLAAHSACPTLVVPARWHEAGLHSRAPQAATADDEADAFRGRVVAAVDGSEAAERVVRQALDVAEAFGKPLTIATAIPLDVETPGWLPNPIIRNLVESPRVRDTAVARLEELIAEYGRAKPGVDVEARFCNGLPGKVFTALSRTVDVLVLGSRGRGGFAGLMLGSVSQEVLGRAECPVLIVPTGKR